MNFVNHWWKHATQNDLMRAKVYDTVREAVAIKQRHRIDLLKAGLAYHAKGSAPLALQLTKQCSFAWS